MPADRCDRLLKGSPVWLGSGKIGKEHSSRLVSHFLHAHSNTRDEPVDLHVTEDGTQLELHQWSHCRGECACRGDDLIPGLEIAYLEREYIGGRTTVNEDPALFPEVLRDLVLKFNGPGAWGKPAVMEAIYHGLDLRVAVRLELVGSIPHRLVVALVVVCGRLCSKELGLGRARRLR